MKIRLDYVSNSSSSSYVLPTDESEGCSLTVLERFKYRDLKPLAEDELISGLGWCRLDLENSTIHANILKCDETTGQPLRKVMKCFRVSDGSDEFISWLMGMSLSHAIVDILNIPGELSITLAESKDGTTNIDDNIIEEFLVRLGKTRTGKGGEPIGMEEG